MKRRWECLQQTQRTRKMMLWVGREGMRMKVELPVPAALKVLMSLESGE